MIRPTSCFVRILEKRVDQGDAIVLVNPGHMEVDHRGLYGAVAETVFHGLDVLPVFQQVGRERVAKGMGGESRVKPGARQDFFEPHTDEMVVDRPVRSESLEHKAHARVAFTVGLQHEKRLVRDGDNPVLAALAALDVDHPPVDVDIGPLQVACLEGAKPAIVDCGKQGLGIQLAGTEQSLHIFRRHHPREFLLPTDFWKGKTGGHLMAQREEIALQPVDEMLELRLGGYRLAAQHGLEVTVKVCLGELLREFAHMEYRLR